MPTYIALCNFTDQGIRNVKNTTKLAEGAKDVAKKFGANITQVYWTLGHYDVVVIIEAPDDKSATAFGLHVGGVGNLRMETLRAFTKEEMNEILGKMA